MDIVQEERHTTLVRPCLSVTRTVDKQIVNDLCLLVVHFQLVPVLVCRPADRPVRVQRQDVV